MLLRTIRQDQVFVTSTAPRGHYVSVVTASALGVQAYIPYMAAAAAAAGTDALQALVRTAAAQRFRYFDPRLGAFGGFPTGSSPRRSAPEYLLPMHAITLVPGTKRLICSRYSHQKHGQGLYAAS